MVRGPWVGRLTLIILHYFQPDNTLTRPSTLRALCTSQNFLQYHFPNLWSLSPKTIMRGLRCLTGPQHNHHDSSQVTRWCGNTHCQGFTIHHPYEWRTTFCYSFFVSNNTASSSCSLALLINTKNPLMGFYLKLWCRIEELFVQTQQISNFWSTIRTVCCSLCCIFARKMFLSARYQSSRCIRDELLTTIPSFVFIFTVFPLSFMGHRPAHGLGSGIQTSSASCLRISGTSPIVGAKLCAAPTAVDTTLSRKSCISIGHITTPKLTPLVSMMNSSIPMERHNSLLLLKPRIIQRMPP